MGKKLKVLVVDDTPENVMLIERFLSGLGHEAIIATNGLEAVTVFEKELPDLVLMDVMMPVMDGYEATARIKAIAGDKWVPVLFLSALSQDIDQAKGLSVGGDDFITKPVNLMILSAKIEAMQRIAEMQRKITDYASELEQYRDDTENEQHLAKHLLDRIIRSNQADGNLVDRWLMPAARFSGDVIVSALTPGNVLHVMLADATGHGLTAAINVMPAIEVFYSMTDKGYSLSSIVTELNRKIKRLLPTERFVAATLVALNPAEKTVEIWNGGNPDVHFINDQGKIIRTWKSSHPALGILNEETLDNCTDAFQWAEPGQLFLCSDGLPEAENADGAQFGWERTLQILKSESPQTRLASLVVAVADHLADESGQDDVSMATISCPIEYHSNVQQMSSNNGVQCPISSDDDRWKLGLTLNVEQLKTLDILPLLLGWLDQLQLEKEHRSKIFLILSELINNAMDHGILAVNSKLKESPEGFEEYLNERNLRLHNLQYGFMTIGIECLCMQHQKFIQIRIQDSGKGFNHQNWSHQSSNNGILHSGRGIFLVKSICQTLTFSEKGNEVIATYKLN